MRPRSAMGSLMPPVDIREMSQMKELEKRIAAGPLTLVLVYADWCGHCQRFKPMMEELEKCPGRSIQTARVRDDMFPNSPIANAKIEGYPTLMLVDKNGKAASFKNESGAITNALPDHTNLNNMKAIVRNAGTADGMKVLNQATVEPEEVMNLNMATAPSMPKETSSIVADRLPTNSVERLNETLLNSRNALENVESPYELNKTKQMGGSLYSQLLLASQKMATPAALLLASQAHKSRRSRRRKTHRKSRGRRS